MPTYFQPTRAVVPPLIARWQPMQSGPLHFLQNRASTSPQALRIRQAIGLADRFYAAAVENHWADDHELKKVLQTVQQQRLHREFQAAVNWELKLDGRPPQSVENLLTASFDSNPVEKIVFKASRDECLDIWRRGNPTYRSHSLSYRLRGMWASLEHFGHVIKEHPVPSLAIMGGVALLGKMKPMLGALSGTAIMLISGASVLKHELHAAEIPAMNEHKAEHFKKSGENLTAFLLTLLGIKGMDKTYRSGYEVLKQPLPLSGQKVGRFPMLGRLKQVLLHKDELNPMTPKELFMFVLGLADDSLLPFNWASHKLNQDKQPTLHG